MRFWQAFIVIAIVLWGALALYLPVSSPRAIFNTPDENANYFFARKFSFSNGLRVFEPLADKLDNAIHPRGVNIIGDFLVPESFLGLPILYGTLFELTKWAWLPLVFTYALTIFAIYALYQLFLHFFERRIARLSLLIVLTLPVLMYWTGRPYMHTILFLDFLVLGWWMMTRVSTRWDIVAGIFLGLTLAMRTSEVIWVGVGTLVLLLPLRSDVSVGLRTVASEIKGGVSALKIAFGAALVIVPLLFVNQDLYGNFFGTGYSVSETNLVLEDGAVPQLSQSSILRNIFLPFGFHPIEAISRFVKYAFGGMWWYVVPMVLGVFVGNWKLEIRNYATRYTLVWLFITIYLIFVYGSFQAEIFADPLHPLEATIGAPYLRYWLPIFVFGAPMAAQFFLWLKGANYESNSNLRISNSQIRRFVKNSLCAPLLVGVVVLSLRAVVWHGPESWHGIQENLWNFAEARERVERATPESAVFIVPRWADRIYFPERRVVVDVEGKDVVQIVRTLHDEQVPVFWHRGRGEIKLEPEIYEAGFKLERRFDLDPKGKVYEIKN